MTSFLSRYLPVFAPNSEGTGGDEDDLVLDDPVGEGDEADEADENPDDSEEEADEPKSDTPPAAAAAPARKPASTKFSALRSRAQDSERRAREAERRADDAERRAREFEMRVHPPQPAETPEQERARLEMMTPEERADYRVNKAINRFQNEAAVSNFHNQDRMDRSTFDAECRVNPLARRFSDEVERELVKIRSEGGNVPRQAVLFYVMGRALYDKESKTRDKRTITAQKHVRSAQARSGNSRGDISGGRSSGGKSLEDRLDGML